METRYFLEILFLIGLVCYFQFVVKDFTQLYNKITLIFNDSGSSTTAEEETTDDKTFDSPHEDAQTKNLTRIL